MKMVVVIVVGLLATLATEFAVSAWLGAGPSDWPMVARYWSITALPAISLVVIVCTALLWLIFRSGKAAYPIAFTLAFMVGLSIELYLFNNPVQDILKYLVIAFGVCLVVFSSAYQLSWKRQQ